MSIKIIADENIITKPKFPRLNFISNLYNLEILYTRINKKPVTISGSVNFPNLNASLILASSFGLRKLIIVAKSRI